MRMQVVKWLRWTGARVGALPPHGPRHIAVVGVVVASAVAVLAGGVLAATHELSNDNPWPYAQPERSSVRATATPAAPASFRNVRRVDFGLARAAAVIPQTPIISSSESPLVALALVAATAGLAKNLRQTTPAKHTSR